jgi:hypothetical protein
MIGWRRERKGPSKRRGESSMSRAARMIQNGNESQSVCAVCEMSITRGRKKTELMKRTWRWLNCIYG